MAQIKITKTTKPSTSIRAKQVCGMFDAPIEDKQTKEWIIDANYEEKDWNIGLIVGPSGSGKSTILNEHFGNELKLDWSKPSVLDDFSDNFSINEISQVCSAVGFNTIPSWLRPYHLLSNGEQFRINLARLLLETPKDKSILVDEFTSVVDRQVAQIGSHAVQKYVRKNNKQFIAASCHYDIIDWLQPDWIIDASNCRFEWRRLQQRPKLDISIKPVGYDAWKLFAPYHYMSADLNKVAKCYVLFVDNRPASFVGLLPMPHPKAKNIWRISRWVTLPDWQGIGLAFVLADTIGAIYKHMGKRIRTTPAHPALIRACDNTKNWKLTTKPGFKPQSSVQKMKSPRCDGKAGKKRNIKSTNKQTKEWIQSSRPCASFEYCGPIWPNKEEAVELIKNCHGSASALFKK